MFSKSLKFCTSKGLKNAECFQQYCINQDREKSFRQFLALSFTKLMAYHFCSPGTLEDYSVVDLLLDSVSFNYK